MPGAAPSGFRYWTNVPDPQPAVQGPPNYRSWLTPRQSQFVDHGQQWIDEKGTRPPNQYLAEKMVVAPGTVDVYIRDISRRCGLMSGGGLWQAVAYGLFRKN